jgi:hypothetical protein
MDEFGNQVRAGIPWSDDQTMGLAHASPHGVAVAMIPGGQVERRQLREGARLNQSVEVRRRDGSVWRAYARQLALPADPGEADRAADQAACVLDLLVQAVAAADLARQARGAMLAWNATPPPWAARFT